MNIKSLQASNILSLGNVSVDFPETGLVLIEGWNHDAQRANGAGKTAIFNAVCFALYDKLPIKITASEILRRGADKGYATVRLQVGDDLIEVTRTRPKGLSVKINDDQISITQEELESKLKLTYEQFMLSMYFIQGSIGRFLLMGDTDKKNFLLQVLNLDIFTKCKKDADEKTKLVDSEIQQLKLKISSNEAKIDTYKESVIDEDELNSSIKEMKDRMQSLAQQIAQLDCVPHPDISKLNALEQDLEQKYKKVMLARNKKHILHTQYRKLESKLTVFNGTSECHSCGSEIDISEAKKHHEQEMGSIRQEMMLIKTEIDECDETASQEKNLDSFRSKLLEKKLSQTRDRDAADKKISQLENQIKLEQKELQNATLKLNQNTNIVNKIQVLAQDNQNNVNLLVHKTNEFEIYKAVSSAFSTTGVQAYVLDSIIDVFNSRVSEYLQLVWSNASYKLNTFKETSKGAVVAKLSEQLTMGDSEVSIGSLSGGELRALSICADLTIIDILEQYSGLTMNPIIMDEPFDGLDSVGRELVIELLSNVFNNKCAMIVDHSSEAKAMFSKIIRVEKKLGISSIIVEP